MTVRMCDAHACTHTHTYSHEHSLHACTFTHYALTPTRASLQMEQLEEQASELSTADPITRQQQLQTAIEELEALITPDETRERLEALLHPELRGSERAATDAPPAGPSSILDDYIRAAPALRMFQERLEIVRSSRLMEQMGEDLSAATVASMYTAPDTFTPTELSPALFEVYDSSSLLRAMTRSYGGDGSATATVRDPAAPEPQQPATLDLASLLQAPELSSSSAAVASATAASLKRAPVPQPPQQLVFEDPEFTAFKASVAGLHAEPISVAVERLCTEAVSKATTRLAMAAAADLPRALHRAKAVLDAAVDQAADSASAACTFMYERLERDQRENSDVMDDVVSQQVHAEITAWRLSRQQELKELVDRDVPQLDNNPSDTPTESERLYASMRSENDGGNNVVGDKSDETASPVPIDAPMPVYFQSAAPVLYAHTMLRNLIGPLRGLQQLVTKIEAQRPQAAAESSAPSRVKEVSELKNRRLHAQERLRLLLEDHTPDFVTVPQLPPAPPGAHDALIARLEKLRELVEQAQRDSDRLDREHIKRQKADAHLAEHNEDREFAKEFMKEEALEGSSAEAGDAQAQLPLPADAVEELQRLDDLLQPDPDLPSDLQPPQALQVYISSSQFPHLNFFFFFLCCVWLQPSSDPEKYEAQVITQMDRCIHEHEQALKATDIEPQVNHLNVNVCECAACTWCA